MLLSIVMPVFNEQEVLGKTIERLSGVLERAGYPYEVVLVNDGSTDRTPALLEAAAEADRRIKVVQFSRNFGHQMALTAGLDFAQGDAVIVMDADLQDPPELIPEMVKLYEAGYDIVSPQRESREGETWFKLATARLFYGIMRRGVDKRLPPEVGDFRLFSSGALAILRQFREQHRFLRGIASSLGLREAIIPYRREARAAGETKYPLWKMLQFSWVAVTSFSALPLRVCLAMGFGLTGLSIVGMVWVLYAALIQNAVVRGWTSLILVQMIFSGSILIAVGLVGEYVARIYEESKGRPLYVVGRTSNIHPDVRPGRCAVLPEHRARPLAVEPRTGDARRV